MSVVFRICCLAFLLFGALNGDVVQNQKVKNVINILSGFSENFKKDTDFNGVHGVIIIPALTKAGLVASGSKGSGIFIARNDNGGWSSPFFVNYTGVGAGLQVGFSSTDLVILMRNSRAYSDLFNGKDTISLNVEFVNLNKGVRKGALTDLPQISAYASERGKSSGAFIGGSVDIAKITINNQDTNDYYERIYDHQDIFDNATKSSKYTSRLHEVLNGMFK